MNSPAQDAESFLRQTLPKWALAKKMPQAQSVAMLIGPHLLSPDALKKYTQIFLCGPGVGAANFQIREFARKTLTSIPNVEVHFGEEIEKLANFKRKRSDLQTLESSFAHSVDYTLLLLESPGSIAELGTFSMMSNLRGRLIILVPLQFYGDSSYITRGPLSLISREFQTNIIYFDRKIDSGLADRILYPLTLYKFAHYKLKYKYRQHLDSAYRERSYSDTAYEDFIGPTRKLYSATAALIGILMLGRPTFPELLAATSLSPDQATEALKTLFQRGKIVKDGNGRYEAVCRFDDEILDGFSTTRISAARAKYIGRLDSGVAA